MSVENWEQGQVLTWSGKWHIAMYAHELADPNKDNVRALCGAQGYKINGIPRYHERLVAIATGAKTAPLCKLCERSAAAQGGAA